MGKKGKKKPGKREKNAPQLKVGTAQILVPPICPMGKPPE